MYRRHGPAAFRRAERLLGSRSDADEVVHEVFLRLFEQESSFKGRSRESTYVYSAVTHACLNRIRNERTRSRLIDLQTHAVVRCDPGTRPEWSLLARDLLRRLPENLATVAIYYYLDELTQREVAEILGCSHTQVAKLLSQLSRFVDAQEKTHVTTIPR